MQRRDLCWLMICVVLVMGLGAKKVLTDKARFQICPTRDIQMYDAYVIDQWTGDIYAVIPQQSVTEYDKLAKRSPGGIALHLRLLGRGPNR